MWTEESKRAFEQLKNAITELSVQRLPDCSKQFVSETDTWAQTVWK